MNKLEGFSLVQLTQFRHQCANNQQRLRLLQPKQNDKHTEHTNTTEADPQSGVNQPLGVFNKAKRRLQPVSFLTKGKISSAQFDVS